MDGTELLDDVRAVVKSPGVPQDVPVLRVARERGLEVTGELELAWRLIPNPFCAVTGTNGKTTTTELLGHLHRAAGEPVAVAGNVGTPLATLATQGLDSEATVVCEASSFQLEDTSAFAPECAVFLNLAPDHLDRHGSLESYRDAKLRVFANQGPEDVAVVNGDEPALAEGALGGAARRVAFCSRGGADGCDVTFEQGEIRWQGESLLAANDLRLLGRPQRRERDGCRCGGDRDRPAARRGRRGAAPPSRGSPTASSACASTRASPGSTTPRRPTSAPPWRASRPSTEAFT